MTLLAIQMEFSSPIVSKNYLLVQFKSLSIFRLFGKIGAQLYIEHLSNHFRALFETGLNLSYLFSAFKSLLRGLADNQSFSNDKLITEVVVFLFDLV